MSLINEALKRAQEELKRRNTPPYPFDASNPSKELYQKSKKPFLIFLFSGIFLGAVTILLLTLIVHPEPVLRFFGSQPTAPLHTQVATQTASTNPEITPTKASFNIAQSDSHLNEAVIEEEAPIDPLQDNALFNTLTEMISKMVAQQAPLNANSQEETHTSSQITAITTQVPQDTSKLLEDKVNPSSLLHEPRNILPEQDPVETFLSKLKVTGIMFSGPESKVIIDNRIYSLRSKVNEDPELRLSEVTPHEIVFEDPEGTLYRKKI